MSRIFDVLVIGAGAVGCSVARELSRYELSVAVLEKANDVADGTSGRNSAVVHAGFNNRPGSLMARLCVEGSRGFEEICAQLDVPFERTGKILVAFDDDDIRTLEHLVEQGKANGCEGLRMIDRNELQGLMSGTGGIAAMLSPRTAIFNPFLYCVAMAENAAENGASFFFDNEVVSIRKEDGLFVVATTKGTYRSRYVINSAGLYADKVSEMAGIGDYHIYPCRGEYLILDKGKSVLPVYPAPKKGIGGLGVHLTPTTDGNIIIGPSADYLDDPSDYSCTQLTMQELLRQARLLLPEIADVPVIGSYSGIRPKLAPPGEGGFRDFVIKEEPSLPGFINLVGIESPGFTASVPIARMVTGMIARKEKLMEKKGFNPYHKAIVRFRDMSEDVQAQMIEKDPEYGQIVCRCQKVTRREIRQAIENPLGVRTVSAVKYRAWATTGRCNGGYCLSRIAEMLVKEYGMKPEEICYRNSGSNMFTGEVRR